MTLHPPPIPGPLSRTLHAYKASLNANFKTAASFPRLSLSRLASDLKTLMDPILEKLLPTDYGDVVSVVVDARGDAMLSKAAELRDRGARVRF